MSMRPLFQRSTGEMKPFEWIHSFLIKQLVLHQNKWEPKGFSKEPRILIRSLLAFWKTASNAILITSLENRLDSSECRNRLQTKLKWIAYSMRNCHLRSDKKRGNAQILELAPALYVACCIQVTMNWQFVKYPPSNVSYVKMKCLCRFVDAVESYACMHGVFLLCCLANGFKNINPLLTFFVCKPNWDLSSFWI